MSRKSNRVNPTKMAEKWIRNNPNADPTGFDIRYIDAVIGEYLPYILHRLSLCPFIFMKLSIGNISSSKVTISSSRFSNTLGIVPKVPKIFYTKICGFKMNFLLLLKNSLSTWESKICSQCLSYDVHDGQARKCHFEPSPLPTSTREFSYRLFGIFYLGSYCDLNFVYSLSMAHFTADQGNDTSRCKKLI